MQGPDASVDSRALGHANTFAFHPANGGARRPVEAATVDQLEAWGLLGKKVDY
jgi:hypothetical protein